MRYRIWIGGSIVLALGLTCLESLRISAIGQESFSDSAGVGLSPAFVSPPPAEPAAVASSPVPPAEPAALVEPQQPPQPARPAGRPPQQRRSGGFSVPYAGSGQPATFEEAEEAKRFRALVQRLRQGGEAEDADEVRQKLRDILSAQLERDLERREAILKRIEQRAEQLRKQLQTRRENTEQTLTMLLMLVENPTAGLGIPDYWMRSLLTPQPSTSDPFGGPRPPASPVLPSQPAAIPAEVNPFGAGGGDDPFSDGETADPFGAAPAPKSSFNPFAQY